MPSGRTALITGGCGYIGSRLAVILEKRGYCVRIVDMVTPQSRGLRFPSTIEHVTADLRDAAAAGKAFEGWPFIVHLAADIGPLTYMQRRQGQILAENMGIDAAVYPAAVAAGVKTIVYSSSSMIFQKADRYPYSEEDACTIPPPTNVYGFSKLAGEYFCRSFSAQYGLSYVILRYHNVYGPGEDSKGSSPGDIHVIPALIQKALKRQYPLQILGSTAATRPFTYVDDAVRATELLVDGAGKGDAAIMNQDFNVGPGQATSIIELAAMIWRLLGDGREFRYEIDDRDYDTAVRREMDPAKLVRATGWQPQVDLEEGILKTAEWLRAREGAPATRRVTVPSTC